ncbi:MAG: maleylpyruvate isomerase N-terminal domain-containing protein [Pseudomonadota bacterium]
MDRPFVAENARERQRLRSLVEGLTDQDLSLSVGTDWTVAVALAHLAFWDQRALALLRQSKSSGAAPSTIDIDVTNESLLPLWLLIPPRAAADLAVSSAEAIDRELEEAPAELITAIEGLGERFRLYRSDHRKLHLDQIETLIGK